MSLSINDLWNRERILDLGVILYDRIRVATGRRNEFTIIAADIMTSLMLIHDLCDQLGPMSTVDPFACPGNRYELSMSLLSVSLNFNCMQLWTRPAHSHEDRITYLAELWTLHSVVRRTAKILVDVRNGKFPLHIEYIGA